MSATDPSAPLRPATQPYYTITWKELASWAALAVMLVWLLTTAVLSYTTAL